MLFAILGSLHVHESVAIRSPVRRAILTALLLRSAQPIGAAELSEVLWEEPPPSAMANIRSHLTGLRRELDLIRPKLGHKVVTYRSGRRGYGLNVTPDELDVTTFARTVREGRGQLLAGRADDAVGTLEEALALWRGPFGGDLPATRWFTAHAAGLNSARIDACQDLFAARILTGGTELLAYRIECALAEAPYRQRLWELLAAVHCVQGDAVGALAVIGRAQKIFAEDLGLDLPPRVEAMRAAALNWDHEEALRLVATHTAQPERVNDCESPAPGVVSAKRIPRGPDDPSLARA